MEVNMPKGVKGFKKGHNGYKRKSYNGDTPYSRYQAIDKYCSECCCGSTLEKKNCKNTHCSVYPYRTGKKITKGCSGKIPTKANAIKNFCTECFGSPKLKRNCSDNSCPFYPYRMGAKNPTGYVRKTIKERITY